MACCKLCSGDLTMMGKLGQLVWLRCRNCGMWFSRKTRSKKR